jgi:hypothetical protein
LLDLTILADSGIILADNTTINLDGDLNFTVDAGLDLTWADIFQNPVFTEQGTEATIDIGQNASINASNISLNTASSTLKYTAFDFFEEGLLGLLAGTELAASSYDPLVTSITLEAPETRENPDTGDLEVLTGAKIIRPNGSGSWITDGFREGQVIKLVGSEFNDDNTFTIASVSNTEIELVETDVLRAEPNTDGVVVTQVLTSLLPSDITMQSTGRDGLPDIEGGSFDAEQASEILQRQVARSGIFDFDLPVEVLLSTSDSEINIQSGANLNALNDISIEAAAVSDLTLETPGLVLGGAYAESSATARTLINSGASLIAGGDIDLGSLVTNTLNLSLNMSSGLLFNQANRFLSLPAPQIGFAYGNGQSQSETLVDAGAVIRGRNVDIVANNTNDFNVEATSKVTSRSNVGLAIGVAVSESDSQSNATVLGTVTSDQDVAIASESLNTANQTASNAVVGPSFPFQQQATQQAQQRLQGQLDSLRNSLQSFNIGAGQAADGGSQPIADVGAGVTLVNGSNRAIATLGDGARVTAGRDLNLTAIAEDNQRASAIGGAKLGSPISIGGAVSIADFSNTADALVDAATVNVTRNLNVQADAIVPNQLRLDDNLLAIRDIDFDAPSFDTGDPAQFYEAVDSYGIQTRQNLDTIGRLTPLLSSTLGVPELVATSFVAASATASGGEGASNFALSGSVNLLTINNRADAVIGEGAQINQTTPAAIADQTVTIEANTRIETINISGIPNVQSIILPATKSEGSSVGGTYNGVTYNNSTHAVIDDNTLVSALGDVLVNAKSDHFAINIVESGTQAQDLGVSGAIGVNQFTNDTLAYIEDTANVTAGNDLTIDAIHDVFALNVTGTILQAGSVGFGASVALNEFEHKTRSLIGDLNGRSPGNKGTVAAARQVNVNATTQEKLFGVSLAGTLVRSGSSSPGGEPTDDLNNLEDPDDPLDGESLPNLFGEQPAQSTQQRSGIGISGDVSINQVTTNTHAYIDDDVTVNAGDRLTVNADNSDAFSLAVSGAAAIDFSQGSSGVAIAGAFTLNEIDRDVQAYVGNASVTAGAVDLNADTTDQKLLSITVGGAGTRRGAASVVGSANVNLLDTVTRAGLADNARVTTSGDITAHALNNLLQVSIAGGFSVGGRVGVGAAADVGVLNQTVESFIGQNATISAGGDIKLIANSQEDLISVGASLAVTNQDLGIAGSGASQNLTNTVQAFVDTGATVTTNQNLLTDSNNDTFAVVVGGAAAGGRSAGIGASVGNSNIDRTVRAFINDGASVTAHGLGDALEDASGTIAGNGVLIDATASDDLYLFGAGGAGANRLAFAASAVVNTLDSDVAAYIGTGASVNNNPATVASPNQSVQLRADHDTNVLSVAGTVAGAAQAGIGAAADAQVITKTVRAYVDDAATVIAADSILINAESQEDLLNIAAGLTGGGKAGVAATAAVYTLDITTEAFIDTAATAIAQGNIIVAADSNANLRPIAGAGGFGGSGGFGASNATVVKTDVTRAFIGENAVVTALGRRNSTMVPTDGDTMTPLTGLSVTATSREDLNIIAAGAAGAGAVGVAGSATVNVLDETTRAFIAAGAQINSINPTLLPASPTQSVNILATDQTTLFNVAGAIAGGGSGGIGAGADVGVITKDTQAFIATDATVLAENNIFLNALSTEDITSIGGGIGIGGSFGIAGAAGVYTTNLTTRASVGDRARVDADGNVIVAADNASEIDLVAGNLAASGTSAFGASAGVAIVNETTEALIGNDAVVNARGLRGAVEARIGEVNVAFTADSRGEGEVSVPTENTTGLGTDELPSEALTAQRTTTATTDQITGLAVTATNRDDIEAIAVSGSVALTGTAAIAGSVNVVNTNTRAVIGDRAQINTPSEDTAGNTQAVRVAAANDFYYLGVAGAASVDAAASIAPGADVAVMSHNTEAAIGNGAQVNAAQDIEVTARGQEEILSVSAGLGLTGGLAVAGAVSVLSLENTTYATIGDNAVVQAGGNALVNASDDTTTDIIAGSGALGLGGVGVGGSVGVTLVTKDTQATIGAGAVVEGNARGANSMTVFTGEQDSEFTTTNVQGVAVQAASTEDLFTVTVSGAGGFTGGIAGAVTVNIVDSDTTAAIADNARINQSNSGDNDQSVHVAAVNDVVVDVVTGGAAVGALLGGVAGGVDIGILRNDTNASIGHNALVNARQDVAVKALALKDIDSLTFSGAAGTIGVAGAVSIYNISSDLTEEARNSLNSQTEGESEFRDVQSYTDDQLADRTLSGLLGGYTSQEDADGDTIGNPAELQSTMQSARSDIDQSRPNDAVGNAVDTETQTASDTGDSSDSHTEPETQPISGTVASVGSGAVVTAGRDIEVEATDELALNQEVGGGTGGIVGVGGAVAIANLDQNTQATVKAGATLSAGDDVVINASGTEAYNGNSISGNGGLVGLGARVVIVDSTSAQTASVGDNVTIAQAANVTPDDGADGVQISARRSQSLEATSRGGEAGLLAAGASIGRITVGGSASATVGNQVTIGQSQNGEATVASFTLDTDSDITASADVLAIAIGIGAGTGNDATVDVDPELTASIGNGTTVNVQNDIEVATTSEIDADTRAQGIAAGAATVGISTAYTRTTPEVNATIGGNASLNAGGDVTIQANHNPSGDPARATASPSSGAGLVGGAGADVDAIAEASISASVGAGARINAAGNVNLTARGTNRAQADVNTNSVGVLVSVGRSLVNSTTGGTIESFMDGAVTARNLTVNATSVSETNAANRVFSAGLGSGSDNDVFSTTSTTANARLGNGITPAAINTTGNVSLQTNAQTDADTRGTGSGGGLLNIGLVETNASRTANVSANVNPGVIINANGDVTVDATHGQQTEVNDGSFALDAVSNGADTITFGSSHGLVSGNQIIYSDENETGNSAIGGLTDGRTYDVIRIDDRTVQLGAAFSAAQVDDVRDVITFVNPHAFETGDRLIYDLQNGANLPGLEPGADYYVRVVDETSIKLAPTLAAATRPPQGLNNPAVVDNAVLELANHGFNTGDAVTYRIPPQPESLTDASTPLERFTFSPGQVNSGADFIDIAAGIAGDDRPRHGFSTGDAVYYTTDSQQPIGGLRSGDIYYVVRLSDSRFALAASRDDAVRSNDDGDPAPILINLDGSGRQGNHQIRPASERPLTGLEDGTTYYAIRLDANRFRLAPTLADAQREAAAIQQARDNDIENPTAVRAGSLTISGDRTGAHTIGVEGVDFQNTGNSNEPDFRIHFDLNSPGGDQRHRLEGAGGALALANAPVGDGIVNSFADSSSFGGAGAADANANVTSNVTTSTTIGSGAQIAGNNIDIGSNAYNLATATSRNFAGGLGAGGDGDTSNTLSNSSITNVNDGAVIEAQGQFRLASLANQQQFTSTEARGVGAIGVGLAESDLDLGYESLVNVGNNVQITTGINPNTAINNDLIIEALTPRTVINAQVNSNGDGAGGGANAFIRANNMGQTPTRVIIGNGAELAGNEVTVRSQASNFNANLNAKAVGRGAGAGVDVDAQLNFGNAPSEVRVNDNATISGLNQVNLAARHNNVTSQVRGRGEVFAFAGGGDVDTTNTHISPAQVITNSASHIKTPDLNVAANRTLGTIRTDSSDREAGPFVFISSGDEAQTLTANRLISFNSLLSSEVDPVLEIDEAGNVIRAYNVGVVNGETDIQVEDIRYDAILDANFAIANNTPGLSIISGNPRFQETYDSLQITNRSGKDLLLNDIDVVHPDLDTIPATTQAPQFTSTSPFFLNGAVNPTQVPRILAPTLVDIQNLSTSDIMITGLIENPHHRTVLRADGDIRSTDSGLIRTRDLQLTSNEGGIGTPDDRVRAQLVQGFGRDRGFGSDPNRRLATGILANPELTAAAIAPVFLDLQGIVRDGRPLTVFVPLIVSTDDINLAIRGSETGTGTPVESTYEFGELRAGGNVIINADGDTNLNGNTDFLGNGRLDVVSGGDIDLTELNGQLVVQRVESTAGNISLSVNDSAAENEDLVLGGGTFIRASQGDVNLQVGDDVEMAMESSITAGDDLAIAADAGNQDSDGSDVTLRGTLNADTITISTHDDRDIVTVNEATYESALVNLGAGNDVFNGGTGNDTVNAGAGDDVVSGNGGDDTLHGGTGNDDLSGNDGNDQLAGEAGADRLAGGAGDDQISGGADSDDITGGSGDDRLNGDAGNDTISGGAGLDLIQGGSGNDTLNGDADNDQVRGGDGDDAINGGTGDDTLDGEAGTDDVSGDDGNDTITGGAGDDFLLGGNGDDQLTGDAGFDVLEGGDGLDIFTPDLEDFILDPDA